MEKDYNKRKIGSYYEQKAVEYLKAHGFTIVELNYTSKVGEIDIIAKDKNTYVFVEVKYRKNDSYGNPLEAIDFRKQNKIRNVARIYIHEKNLYNYNIRFDAIAILNNNITHIKDAF